ncbi:MAG: P-loop NTPase fold protein [Pseudomonadota bacterium]|nr:P-loop NTPase fold protein [Pseudomonadota bacterium]
MSYRDFKIVLDVPSTAPGLGFDEYAEALCGIIEGSDPHFSIGLFGGWGSGKSTLMHRIHEKLDSNNCIPIEFSAWRYEKEEHLIVPLLDAIRAGLIDWADLNSRPGDRIRNAVKETTSVIGKATESIIRGFSMKIGIPQVVDLSFDANKALTAAADHDAERTRQETPRSFYFACFKSLRDCFTEFRRETNNKRIVVFIDDLDRCLPESALEVLESMKLFFDFDGFVFVVGLDQQVVEWCIDNRYAQYESVEDEQGFRIKGSDYIKKIFQVPFTLPPVAQQAAQDMIEAVIAADDLPAAQKQDLRDRVRPHLEHFLASGKVNLRDIKRFLNSYVLIMKVHPGLNPDVVLALQTAAFIPEWREVYEAIRVNQTDLTHELRNMSIGDPHCVEEIAPELRSLPLSFERYIADGAPGAALVREMNLGPYVGLSSSASAAESDFGSSFDSIIVEIMRNVSSGRRMIQNADFNNLERDRNLLRDAVEHFVILMKYTSELRQFPGARELESKIDAIRGVLEELSTDRRADRIDTAQDREAIKSRILDQVADISSTVRGIRASIRMR